MAGCGALAGAVAGGGAVAGVLARVAALAAAAVLLAAAPAAAVPVGDVDPFVGVDAEGNTVPGPKLPFGFANPSPDTLDPTTSGYRSGRPVVGFSQTHVSGTGGAGKYGNFRLTPFAGPLRLGDLGSPITRERAAPGRYAARLTRAGIDVALTATRRVALHRYRFPATRQAHLLLDATSAIELPGGGRPLASKVRLTGPAGAEGWVRMTGGWGVGSYRLFFALRLDRRAAAAGTFRAPPAPAAAARAASAADEVRVLVGERPKGAPHTELAHAAAARSHVRGGADERTGVWLRFDARRQRTVTAAVALSFRSVAQARRNLSELDGRAPARRGRGARAAARRAQGQAVPIPFDAVAGRATAAWRDVLGRIAVSGGTAAQRRTFASALYRAHAMPHDLTGEDVWTGRPQGAPHYEDFYALWDTFRTVNPLLTVLQPRRAGAMVAALTAIARASGGWPPDGRVAGTNGITQVGSSAEVVIADAFAKGLGGFDRRAAAAAAIKSATVSSPRPLRHGRDLGEYAARGFLTTASDRSASRTLEFGHGDFAVAQIARAVGQPALAASLEQRSRAWAQLWDPETEAIRPRTPDGGFLAPFDPAVEMWGDGHPFYEGSALQWSTFVPHDAGGLLDALGGPAPFAAWLDRLFDGGHHSQRNEPDLLAPWLYAHAGRSDRVAERVQAIMRRDYRPARDGLPGNDDAGTLSAWYVWAAIGLFPNAGQPWYYVTAPLFERATIALAGGRALRIVAVGAPPAGTTRYVASARLDGRPLGRAWLTHAELAAGGTLELRLSATPTGWAAGAPPPPSLTGPGSPAAPSGAAASARAGAPASAAPSGAAAGQGAAG
ncbi:GH92 family glycosyl hydrolase [Conexibacter arvalis]|uniref:GH92 family glycosyl hydrolase n=1 Tax=Conexibacter arvalis TaxID=912552 RepID=UPI00160CF5BD